MEGEKEIQKIETQEEFEKDELLSEKALEDDFELDEDLDKLPIQLRFLAFWCINIEDIVTFT